MIPVTILPASEKNDMRRFQSFSLAIAVVGLGFTLTASTFAAGNLIDSPTLADLIYEPVTGNVKLDASEAPGAVVTSFQLENATNAFLPGNYISLNGTAGFGGAFEDATTAVIGDSDGTFVGFGGVVDLGNIFPAGLDPNGVAALLTTASFVGQAGSGIQTLDIVIAAVQNPPTRVPVTSPVGLAALGAAFALGGMLIARRRLPT